MTIGSVSMSLEVDAENTAASLFDLGGPAEDESSAVVDAFAVATVAAAFAVATVAAAFVAEASFVP